ncbi:unnamed protein product [Adineta steineri]|uniref:Uncharacterized protein n=1 Tax=Adineta steineri TaxID=433720 RepID=A0A815QTF5_9BILA|nr:unnamed protein product [Adineta steineri]CAF1466305.1 unnamed protein product [Adineta steineri]CAF3884175.1 unnamed protein product [Adineta steineri]CAF4146217.1 unnamed protein product [Adineta steineri]
MVPAWMRFLLILSSVLIGECKDIIVQNPFYLRARIHDAHTASIQFEIAPDSNQRKCQMYKFTIRRNREYPYSMPEQNLTFWRNSLEMKHLDSGSYRVCAMICSEYIYQAKNHYQFYTKKNRTIPITTCIDFYAHSSHLLVLTLYILVAIFLIIAQIVFSLRKRQFQARIKMALIEIDNSLQKWRTAQPVTTDQVQPYTTLQSLVTRPASFIEQSMPQSNDDDGTQSIIFQLELPSE